MVEAVRCGARGVVSSRVDRGPAADPPLTGAHENRAERHGSLRCNCMGFADVERGLRAVAFEERPDLDQERSLELPSGRPSRRCARGEGDTLQPRVYTGRSNDQWRLQL